MGTKEGPKEAAIAAWQEFGEVLADGIANALTLIDGITVIGGGLSGAYPLFLPTVVENLNRNFIKPGGGSVPRMEVVAYNLEDEEGLKNFLTREEKMIRVPFSDDEIPYLPEKKVGVGVTRLGTSRAVAVGAYAFAAKRLG